MEPLRPGRLEMSAALGQTSAEPMAPQLTFHQPARMRSSIKLGPLPFNSHTIRVLIEV